MGTIKVVVFDSNETLLDLSPLDPLFRKAYGDAEVRKKWFKGVLELFLTATVIDDYRSFDVLADAALDMAAKQYGTADGSDELAQADRAAIHAKMQEGSAHPDVRPALERLRNAGFRLAVLTNSTKKSVQAQLKHAGIAEYFDELLSVDGVKRYKPAREAYAYAARELDVDLDEMRMVATHAWDIAGAMKAGCKAAWVHRPEKALNPRTDEPEIAADDMMGVAAKIIEKDG